jgi:TatD DNase family protein
MIDSHCHLADEAFAGDLPEVIARARDAGLTGAMCILSAGDAEESKAAARVRELWPEVIFAVGVHPHTAGRFTASVAEAVSTVRRALGSEGARAIGEIGLDYHYDFAPRDVQRQVFEAQVALALELDLAVIIHTREATDDTFEVLAPAAGRGLRGVFHCFTGDVAMARRALDIGFYISMSGIVSFPKAGTLREVAALVPPDRLLIETDSPYLAPVPHRGKRNEPGFVARVAEVVGESRGRTAAEVAAITARNLAALLGPNASFPTA